MQRVLQGVSGKEDEERRKFKAISSQDFIPRAGSQSVLGIFAPPTQVSCVWRHSVIKADPVVRSH